MNWNGSTNACESCKSRPRREFPKNEATPTVATLIRQLDWNFNYRRFLIEKLSPEGRSTWRRFDIAMGAVVQAAARTGKNEATRVRLQARVALEEQPDRRAEVGDQDEEFGASLGSDANQRGEALARAGNHVD